MRVESQSTRRSISWSAAISSGVSPEMPWSSERGGTCRMVTMCDGSCSLSTTSRSPSITRLATALRIWVEQGVWIVYRHLPVSYPMSPTSSAPWSPTLPNWGAADGAAFAKLLGELWGPDVSGRARSAFRSGRDLHRDDPVDQPGFLVGHPGEHDTIRICALGGRDMEGD